MPTKKARVEKADIPQAAEDMDVEEGEEEEALSQAEEEVDIDDALATKQDNRQRCKCCLAQPSEDCCGGDQKPKHPGVAAGQRPGGRPARSGSKCGGQLVAC